MGTPERVNESAQSDNNHAESDTYTANGEEKEVQNNTIAAVLYKLLNDRDFHARQHVRICQSNASESKVDWRKEVAIFAKYLAYQGLFTGMLSAFQCK